MKAGLMEIADFFVLNKADRAGADQAVTSIKTILHFRDHAGWNPDVVKAVASEGKGTAEVAAKVAEHRAWLEADGRLAAKRRARMGERVRHMAAERLGVDLWTPGRRVLLEGRLTEVMEQRVTPYEVVEEILRDFRQEEP
jgi:LAO/AO transport system kinase